MKTTTQNNYFILSGAMGSGKSTVLNALKKLGINVIDEPARQILAEQRSIQGDGVPETNSRLFTELMLSRSIMQYKQSQSADNIVVFDRGIADNIAYSELFNFELNAAQQAAARYRYNKQVFICEPWEAIYCTDDERKMSFHDAKQFGETVESIYTTMGYHTIKLPFTSPTKRALFIIDTILENKG